MTNQFPRHEHCGLNICRIRMRGECCPGSLAITGNNIHPPGGKPASSINSPSCKAERGVYSAFKTVIFSSGAPRAKRLALVELKLRPG